MTRHDLKSQSGAIMLEVIAVLSLMGLMGTMLYRQIYLRNQELHNIQMASEIRVIKEAYSAYIQANAVLLHSRCGTASTAVARCEAEHACGIGTCLYEGVSQFVPDGYFFDSASGGASAYIQSNYDLSLWCYNRGDTGHQLKTCYGIIVPKPNVLPDGGSGDTWSFRRAARVAMLIGIDGGAYSPDITVEDGNKPVIAGAVGTWSLPIDGIIVECNGNCSTGNNLKDCGGDFCPTYVALTGLDIFQPEIEMPQGEVNLPDDFSLVLNGAHVYDSFSAGGSSAGGKTCYTIAHDTSAPDATGKSIVNSDTVPNLANCRPAFYVEGGAVNGTGDATGNVRVLNDLTVGQGYDSTGHATEAAMRFDKNGMIVFEKAVVADPETGHKLNYVLDPQYTSVMNDIKIMSRGGARLSEILPNYILKEVVDLSSVTKEGGKNYWKKNIPSNYCSKGYRVAMQVAPHNWPEAGSPTKQGLDKGNVAGSGMFVKGLTSGSDVVTDVAFNKRAIYVGTTAPSSSSATNYKQATQNQDYFICFGTLDASDHIVCDSKVTGTLSIYCVFDKDDFEVESGASAQTDCEAKGGTYSSGKCSLTAPTQKRSVNGGDCTKLKTQGTCELAGCKWDGAGSTCTPSPSP